MAETVAERIRGCLRRDTDSPPLTVSIGAAEYPEDGCTAQQMLEVADRRLYAGKRKSAGERFQTASAE